jgi:beta-hydroxylase
MARAEGPLEERAERPGCLSTLGLILLFGGVRVVQGLIGWTRSANKKFFDPAEFPWIAEVEAGWKDVREELGPVLDRKGAMGVVPNFQAIQIEEARLTQDDLWKVLILVGYGVRHETNLARFPRTAALLEKIPGLTTAMFSILRERKHIPPHVGPYKGVLRYHLALKVPVDPEDPDACRIRVGDETRTWTEGKSLVFDDTHEHEVWKDTDGTRAILFVDFIRPLPWPLSTFNRWAMHGITYLPFIARANDRLKLWEAEHGAELDALVRRGAKAKKAKAGAS